MDPVEGELLTQFRAGDEDAARELFDRFSGEMMNLVRRRLSGLRRRTGLDSEGILQEGFRSFFSAIKKPTFDPERASLGALLNTIVSRKVCLHLRRKYPPSVAAGEIGAVRDVTAALLDADLSEPEMAAALWEAVSTTLEEFTDRERLVLELYLDPWNEASAQDIARLRRTTTKSVNQTIAHFTDQLRRLLAEDGGTRAGA
jgi:RNA polymerase sigma factor (sigma-70 family)